MKLRSLFAVFLQHLMSGCLPSLSLPTGMTGYAVYLSPDHRGCSIVYYCLVVRSMTILWLSQCHSFLQEGTQILSPVCRVVKLSLRVWLVWQFLSTGIALRSIFPSLVEYCLLSLSVGSSMFVSSIWVWLYPGISSL